MTVILERFQNKRFIWLIVLLILLLFILNYSQKEEFVAAVDCSCKSMRTHIVSTPNHTENPVSDTDKYALSLQIPNLLTAEDLYISIKSTGPNHKTRMPIIMKTWYNWARNEIYLITDANDTTLYQTFGKRLIITKCGGGYDRDVLKCKLLAEFNEFFGKHKRWWCHVDDDNYLNIPALLKVLSRYDYNEKVAIGKPSLHRPWKATVQGKMFSWWFGTGGAGYCFSKKLMGEMKVPMTKHFMEVPDADDVSIFYVSDVICNTRMTVELGLFSHLLILENTLPPFNVTNQITLSYQGKNTVNFNGKFNKTHDPTRFLSVYCVHQPDGKVCL